MGNRDNFDLGDFSDFDEPSFTSSNLTEDVDLTPSEVITTQGGRNTRFVVLATALTLLILIGAVGIILLALDVGFKNQIFQQTAAAVYATNTQVALYRALTETAASWTDTPTYTPTATDTPTPTATATDTPTETPDFGATMAAQQTLDFQATQTASILQLTANADQLTQTFVAAQLTAIVEDKTRTAQAQTGAQLTQAAIQLTQAAAQLTQIAINAQTQTAAATFGTILPTNTLAVGTSTPQPVLGTPTPVQVEIVGPIVLVTHTPIPTLSGTELRQTEIALGTTTPTLPHTGFFDDGIVANAGPMGVTMVTVSALGLVGVIFAARRMRIRGV
ncbi:MAG: hypothetical protein U0528_15620 [Anaerolineae bacterium]